MITFVVLVVVLLSFLLAPLICLAVAFLTYSLWRPSRGRKSRNVSSSANLTGTTADPDRSATYGFGAGTS